MTIINFIDTQNNQQQYTFNIDENNNIKDVVPSKIDDAIFSYGRYINNNLNMYYYVSGIVWIHIYNEGKILYKKYYIPLSSIISQNQPQKIGTIQSKSPIQFPTPDKNYNSDLTNFNNYVTVLDDKKEDIEYVLNVQNRLNMFNDTYNKRYIQYIKIICIIIFGIICIWLTKSIYNLNIIPQGFLTFIIIIIISIVIIFIYYIYQDILIHNLLKFDEIDFHAPEIESRNNTISGNTLSVYNSKPPVCTSCPSGFTYKSSTGMCSRSLF